MAVQRHASFFPDRVRLRRANMQAADYTVQFGGSIYMPLGTPAAADSDGLVDGATMVNGSAVTVTSFLTNSIPGDFGRILQFVASAANTRAVTITGFDYTNARVVETVTLAGTTVVYSKKTYSRLESLVFASSTDTTTVDVGWANGLGLPYKLNAAEAAFINGVPSAVALENFFLQKEIGQTELLAGTSMWVVSPVRAYVVGLRSVVQTAINTGDAITVEIGGTAVSGLSVTHGADAAGVVQSDSIAYGEATALVLAGGALEIIPGASFATAGAVNAMLELVPAEVVRGDGATATATTRDTRGVYWPTTAPDGTNRYGVQGWVDITEMDGVDQYTG